jgi:hypothetical protein
MIEVNAAAVVRVTGFTVGAILYAMILTMVLPERWWLCLGGLGRPSTSSSPVAHRPVDRLLLATALLGVVWNGHGLLTWAAAGTGLGRPGSLDLAVAHTALGFLPAVLVHAVLRAGPHRTRQAPARLLMAAAYGLSATVGMINLASAGARAAVPSVAATRLAIAGFLAIGVLLGFLTRSQGGPARVLWMVSLAVFAVSVRHLAISDHLGHSWLAETLHHTSLPLVAAILYQDYPFALADRFLKRALTLLLVTVLALVAYSAVIAPLFPPHLVRARFQPVAAILGLCLGTALLYPLIRSAADRFVDKVVLHRTDYRRDLEEFASEVERCTTAEEVLPVACRALSRALGAEHVVWEVSAVSAKPVEQAALERSCSGVATPGTGAQSWLAQPGRLVDASWQGTRAVAVIPTTEGPCYDVTVDALTHGRRLLSDDISLLESVARMAGRRIDAVRLTAERVEQTLRQHELHELAIEAELRALRAQLHPHFLFNALNTVGSLIQTSPGRAFATLLRLTDLLRRVLRTEGEFTTLGAEMELAMAYLNIEQARFEERLRVHQDLPDRLRPLQVPTLLLQPLVENAVRHGIAPQRAGGEVTISARVTDSDTQRAGEWLCIAVHDTGTWEGDGQPPAGSHHGIGLRNVETRLRHYYGGRSSLVLRAAPEGGTLAEIWIPLDRSETVPRVSELRVEGLSRP